MKCKGLQKSSRKKWHLAGLFVLALVSSQISEALADSSLTIADIRWAHEITVSKDPAPDNILTFAPAAKPLYLWVKLRGDSEALETLKTKRKLTVIHKWEYNHFGWKTERIDVSIGRDRKLDDATLQQLQYELETKGYFEWRTWSKKENLGAHTYTVTVVDGFDEPFACLAELTCTMKMTIE